MVDRRRKGRAPIRLGGPFARMAVVFLALAAIGLTVFTRDAAWVDAGRGVVDDNLAPAQNVAGAPFSALRRLGDGVSSHFRVHAENERLRRENEILRDWRDLALAMSDKMQRYERLLNALPDPDAEAVVARVVAETAGPFVRSRLLNAGRDQGVRRGQAAMSERGLVGRVVSAGARSARILMLTDPDSRIPVLADRNDTRAILVGDNTDNPLLEFLPRGHGLREGDRIATSGDAGQLPRGLAVGVAYNDDSGVWRVRLYSADAPVDQVRVVRFNYPPPPEEEPAVAEGEDGDAPQEEAGGARVASAGENDG